MKVICPKCNKHISTISRSNNPTLIIKDVCCYFCGHNFRITYPRGSKHYFEVSYNEEGVMFADDVWGFDNPTPD